MDKGKIVELFPDQQDQSKENMLRVLRDMIADVEAGKVENFAIAAKLSDGTIGTGWANCDIGQRQELVSHLQVDIFYKIVYVNLVGE